MLVGRNFWKSSLLEFEKAEISLSSSKFVISLMDLMAHSCAIQYYGAFISSSHGPNIIKKNYIWVLGLDMSV